VVIVNETFARRHFPNGDALGKRVRGGDWDPKYPWTTIVGVASDVAYGSALWDGTGETFYTAFEQNLWLRSSYVVLKVAGGDPTTARAGGGEKSSRRSTAAFRCATSRR
jgi:hypothetical protein